MDGDIIMSMMENVAKDLTSAMKEQVLTTRQIYFIST